MHLDRVRMRTIPWEVFLQYSSDYPVETWPKRRWTHKAGVSGEVNRLLTRQPRSRMYYGEAGEDIVRSFQ